jgi:hypothetical protein
LRKASAAELTNVAIETVEIKRIEHSDRDKALATAQRKMWDNLIHCAQCRATSVAFE